MTISPPAAPAACPPRIASVPPHVDSADSPGTLAVELAAAAGLLLDPWQQLVLESALALRPDGKWAAFEVGLVVPRQNGKGSVLEALELAGLFLPEPGGPPPLILHSAHEFKTSAEHFRRMRDLVEGSDQLVKQVRIVRTAAGSESIELHSGARLRFVTRTGGSGRGFSADTIVIDEAYNLTAESMAAVLPTMSARPNPQVWYTSSAGMVASDQLARVRQRGQSGSDPRLAYFEWSAEPDADLDDRGAWYAANPALGVRITEDFVAAERAALPDEQFARERLGIWADPVTEAMPIQPGAWADLTDPASLIVGTPSLSVDVTPHGTAAAIGAAGLRGDGLVHVEVVEHRRGTGWVVERLAQVAEKAGARVVHLDPAGPAGLLVAGIEGAGLRVELLSARDLGQACGGLAEGVKDDRVRHLPQPELASAVAGAVTRNIGDGAWAWARKSSTVDISPLVAVTVAAWAVSKEGPNPWDAVW